MEIAFFCDFRFFSADGSLGFGATYIRYLAVLLLTYLINTLGLIIQLVFVTCVWYETIKAKLIGTYMRHQASLS